MDISNAIIAELMGSLIRALDVQSVHSPSPPSQQASVQRQQAAGQSAPVNRSAAGGGAEASEGRVLLPQNSQPAARPAGISSGPVHLPGAEVFVMKQPAGTVSQPNSQPFELSGGQQGRPAGQASVPAAPVIPPDVPGKQSIAPKAENPAAKAGVEKVAEQRRIEELARPAEKAGHRAGEAAKPPAEEAAFQRGNGSESRPVYSHGVAAWAERRIDGQYGEGKRRPRAASAHDYSVNLAFRLDRIGRVDLHMAATRDGRLRVRVSSERKGFIEALEAELGPVKDAVADMGLVPDVELIYVQGKESGYVG